MHNRTASADSMIGAVSTSRLFLIDAFGFIFRAYHARARSGAAPMRTSAGLSTEAVYIFNKMVRKLTREYQPTHLAAVFESEEPALRVVEFADYKANRAETPPELTLIRVHRWHSSSFRFRPESRPGRAELASGKSSAPAGAGSIRGRVFSRAKARAGTGWCDPTALRRRLGASTGPAVAAGNIGRIPGR